MSEDAGAHKHWLEEVVEAKDRGVWLRAVVVDYVVDGYNVRFEGEQQSYAVTFDEVRYPKLRPREPSLPTPNKAVPLTIASSSVSPQAISPGYQSLGGQGPWSPPHTIASSPSLFVSPSTSPGEVSVPSGGYREWASPLTCGSPQDPSWLEECSLGDEGNPSLSDAHSAPASPAITTGRVEPVPACSPSVSQVRDDSGIVGTCPVCPNAAFRSVGGFLGHVNRHLVHRVPVPAEFWASQEVLQLCTGCGLAFQMRNKARVRCAKCRKAGTAISARPPCDDLSAPAPLAAVPGPPLSSFPSLDDIFRKPWPSVQRVPTSVRKGWARRYAKLCSDAALS